MGAVFHVAFSLFKLSYSFNNTFSKKVVLAQLIEEVRQQNLIKFLYTHDSRCF